MKLEKILTDKPNLKRLRFIIPRFYGRKDYLTIAIKDEDIKNKEKFSIPSCEKINYRRF